MSFADSANSSPLSAFGFWLKWGADENLAARASIAFTRSESRNSLAASSSGIDELPEKYCS
jgi:hypothetical protein